MPCRPGVVLVAALVALACGPRENPRRPVRPAPVTAAPGRIPVPEIAATEDSVCLLEQGEIRCWAGQPRVGLPSLRAEHDVRQIAATENWICGLVADGGVACWILDPDWSSTPTSGCWRRVLLEDTRGLRRIAAGPRGLCGIAADGGVACWMVTEDVRAGWQGRVEISGPHDAIEVALGSKHACALRRSGGVFCWGNDATGRLGNGPGDATGQVVDVADVREATQIAATDTSTCVLERPGTVRCWGDNHMGQLGNGRGSVTEVNKFSSHEVSSDPGSDHPAPVFDLGDAVAITAGQARVCALRRDSAVECWGEHAQGTEGTCDRFSDEAYSFRPIQVSTRPSTRDVQVLGRFTCLQRLGRLECWTGEGSGCAVAQGRRITGSSNEASIEFVVAPP